jgi:hypothetical protein
MPVSSILAAVDLNGDSKTDLVIGSNPFAYVFLGAGNGTFTLKDTYSEAPNNSRQSIAIADFDGDGKPDVASNNTVLLGKGDGSLQGNQAVSLGNALGQGVTGDFNRDGNPDLAAVSANNANNLYILSGNSTGKLTLAHTDTLPLPFDAIATADLRGNGGLDLVFITHDPVTQISILNVMLGNSDGSFASPNTFPQGSVARVSTIAFADFNGDHAPDLAVLSTDGLTVFLGNGDGTFGAPAAFFAGSSPTSFATSDFNGDGVTDVAVASMAGIGILVGKGDGTFKPATFPISVLSNVLSSASADLNGDGKADLVTSNGTNLQVFLGNGDATFAALPPIALPGSKLLNVVDIDGDGKLDLVVSMGLRVLLGNGDGTFSEPLVIVPQESHAGNRFLSTADLNGDHHPDVALDLPTGVLTLLNLAGTSPNFSLTVASTTTATVKAGQTASYWLVLSPVGGLNQTVMLACTGVPALSSCSVSPTSLTLDKTTTAIFTVNTTASTAAFFTNFRN